MEYGHMAVLSSEMKWLLSNLAGWRRSEEKMAIWGTPDWGTPNAENFENS